ncbi:hypothetical protein ACG3RN_15375, partial [Pseudomonas aeruginosa]
PAALDRSSRRRQRLGEEKRQQYAWIARKP